MAVDFEISSLSGTGTATIRVKPKAVNTEQTPKEQVLKVIVQGVEREVTLVQGAAPEIKETWKTFFSISPDSTSITFDDSKRNETKEISVYSYQQKFLDNEPQDEYRAVDWKLESSSDWLEVTQEVGEANVAGKLTIKTKSSNEEYEPSSHTPIPRDTTIKIISQQEPNPEIILNITQSAGTPAREYVFEPTVNIPLPGIGQGTNTRSFSNVKAYRYNLINSKRIVKFEKQFKITDISKTIEGQWPITPGMPVVPFKVWIHEYSPSNVANTWTNSISGKITIETNMSGVGGMSFTWQAQVMDETPVSAEFKAVVGFD